MQVTPHTHRRWFLRSLAVAALMALSANLVSASAPLSLVRVSTDPYTNTSSMHQTELEPDTFSYGSTIIGTFQVGRFNDGGASNIGWVRSTDNGATWTNGFLPGITIYGSPAGPYQRVSDPSVVYDAMHHVWMIMSLPLNGGGAGLNMSVNRSTDGGATWDNPVQMVNQSGLDKNWITCDNTPTSPYYGHCYGEWDYNAGGNLMQMTTSTDGGLTWSPPIAPSGNPSGLGGQPLVLSTGRVVVPYSANFGPIRSFVSTNGGTSWSSVVTVATVTDHGVAGNIRTSALPSAEVDARDRVYVVWQDCRFRTGCSSNDIVMSTSTDGLTWSAVTRIPIDATTSTFDHFIPGIAADRNRADPITHLALTYYYYPTANCTTTTCQLSVGFVSSIDGGATWTSPVQLAGPMTPTWLPLTNQGYMVGDYISTSISSDGKAHTVFSVATAPSGGIFDEAMYAPVPGLSLGLSTARLKGAPTTNPVTNDPQLYFGPSTRLLPNTLPTAH